MDRVLLDGDRATGVLTAGGERYDADEVILSAGAIHSPAILLRSGIGPTSGLPVGANLVDHPATPGFELALTPAGRLAPGDASVLTSMLRYSSGMAGAGDNDMQVLWLSAVGASDDDRAGGRVLVAAMQSFSRGEVRLASTDPLVDPIVEFRMLSDQRDLMRLREATARIGDVLRHPAVEAIVETVHAAGTPLGSLDSDAAVDTWLTGGVNDYVHAAGTCRMGTPGDPAAVVDLECRVIGREGCGSATPRSCPTCRGPTPTSRRWPSPKPSPTWFAVVDNRRNDVLRCRGPVWPGVARARWAIEEGRCWCPPAGPCGRRGRVRGRR